MTQTVPEPPRIARLPKDKRGYPIPWNVLIGKEGTPLFTVNDDRRHWEALKRSRCPVCGMGLKRWRMWIGGPRSAFDEHGWYLDLPMHSECAEYALQVCPYLAAPRYLGRIDVADWSKVPGGTVLFDDTLIPERPELMVAVLADRMEVHHNEGKLPYNRPVKPVRSYDYWRHGQRLTAEQALLLLRDRFGRNWNPPKTKTDAKTILL